MDYADSTWGSELESLLRAGGHPVAAEPWGNVRCEPGWSWSPTLTDYDLWFARSGYGEAMINGRRHEITPFTVLLVRPGDKVVVRQDPQRRLSVVYCHFSFGPVGPGRSGLWEERLLPERVLQVAAHSEIEAALLTAVRAAQTNQIFAGLGADLAVCRALLAYYREDAARCGHPVASPDGRIQAVVDLIRSDPGRRHTLAAAADRANLSPTHFSMLFRDQVGVTFREFMVTTRLDRAARLLTETPMTVAEISDALGYRDSYLFSRQFKARFGVPPSGRRSTPARRRTTRSNHL